MPPFVHVLTVDEARAVRKGEPSAIQAACASLALASSANLMLVSDQVRAPAIARLPSRFHRLLAPGARQRQVRRLMSA